MFEYRPSKTEIIKNAALDILGCLALGLILTAFWNVWIAVLIALAVFLLYGYYFFIRDYFTVRISGDRLEIRRRNAVLRQYSIRGCTFQASRRKKKEEARAGRDNAAWSASGWKDRNITRMLSITDERGYQTWDLDILGDAQFNEICAKLAIPR
jgi:hypothetical protein